MEKGTQFCNTCFYFIEEDSICKRHRIFISIENDKTVIKDIIIEYPIKTSCPFYERKSNFVEII